MASFGHVAVGMMAGRIWARGEPAPALARAMSAFSALSLAPDLDALGFRVGIAYSAPLGHRGATHSILAALLLASVAASLEPLPRRERARLWLLCALVALSHGLLDSLTDGGLGVATLWPFSAERFFAPWSPIPVAPIGARGMLSARGLHVVGTEMLLFAPLWLWALWPRRDRGAG